MLKVVSAAQKTPKIWMFLNVQFGFLSHQAPPSVKHQFVFYEAGNFSNNCRFLWFDVDFLMLVLVIRVISTICAIKCVKDHLIIYIIVSLGSDAGSSALGIMGCEGHAVKGPSLGWGAVLYRSSASRTETASRRGRNCFQTGLPTAIAHLS